VKTEELEIAKRRAKSQRKPRCTCGGSEYNTPRSKMNRHTLECPLSPDTTDWMWYPHSGEIESGGVLVNPKDRSKIYLLVKGYLAPAFLEKDHDKYESA